MFKKKKYLEKIDRKRSGFKKIAGGLYLDRNERAVTFSNKIKKDLEKVIGRLNLNHYPELDQFYSLIAEWKNVKSSNLFLTEGVSGAIKSIIENFTVPGESNIIFPHPSFALYDVYAKMFNLKSKYLKYNNYKLNLTNIPSLIDKNTSIIFLANPNLPIEGYLDNNEIKRIATICKQKKILLVIDEVYYPFSKESSAELLSQYSDLIIMQSFSKAFGLAAIRLGYIIASRKNIEYISKTRTGYETNSVSMAIASYFIKNYHIIDEYINDVREGINFLRHELNKMMIEFNGGTNSNYIFINLNNRVKTKKIIKGLKEANIFVRGNWPKPFDEGFLVSGAPKKELKLFFKEFKELYEKH